MYQLIQNTTPIAVSETITYNLMQPNGCYGLAKTPEDAQGVVANGEVYHLEGRPQDGYEGLPSVTITEISAADVYYDAAMRLIRGEAEPEPLPEVPNE